MHIIFERQTEIMNNSVNSDVISHMPVDGFDVHLQAVAAGGPVATLLTHKQFLTAMFGCLMQT